MSKIKLTGDSSGYVEISAGENAANNTLELPTSGTKIVASDSSNNVNALGIVTATSFSGALSGTATTATNLADGANITTGTISNDRLPATITKNLTGNVTGNVTGNLTGDVNAGVVTATSSIIVDNKFINSSGVGIGTTDTTGRNAGVGTATGTVIYNSSTSAVEVYTGSAWVQLTVTFSASGGTEDTSTRSGYKVHTFTGSGELKVNGGSKTAEILVIGGGGGASYGGGGAGALIYRTGVPLVPGPYSITVGGGGAGGNLGPGAGAGYGPDGTATPSTAFGYTAAGGGGGAYPNKTPTGNGMPGGSGGGGYQGFAGGSAAGSPGGSGGSVSPTNGWGYDGGAGSSTGGTSGSGGGGGAGAQGTAAGPGTIPGPGQPAPHGLGGNGGNGLAYSITGISVTRAGGGGGATYYQPSGSYPSANSPLVMGRGGSGGGGSGFPGSAPNKPGTANTGGGGGSDQTGAAGGSGIVIIAYPTS